MSLAMDSIGSFFMGVGIPCVAVEALLANMQVPAGTCSRFPARLVPCLLSCAQCISNFHQLLEAAWVWFKWAVCAAVGLDQTVLSVWNDPCSSHEGLVVKPVVEC